MLGAGVPSGVFCGQIQGKRKVAPPDRAVWSHGVCEEGKAGKVERAERIAKLEYQRELTQEAAEG